MGPALQPAKYLHDYIIFPALMEVWLWEKERKKEKKWYAVGCLSRIGESGFLSDRYAPLGTHSPNGVYEYLALGEMISAEGPMQGLCCETLTE